VAEAVVVQKWRHVVGGEESEVILCDPCRTTKFDKQGGKLFFIEWASYGDECEVCGRMCEDEDT